MRPGPCFAFSLIKCAEGEAISTKAFRNGHSNRPSTANAAIHKDWKRIPNELASRVCVATKSRQQYACAAHSSQRIGQAVQHASDRE